MRVFSDFLQARDEQPLPDTIAGFFRNAMERARAFKDRGNVKLIECADAALAERIANAKAMKGYCLRAGDHHLVVPSNREQHSARARKAGLYLVVLSCLMSEPEAVANGSSVVAGFEVNVQDLGFSPTSLETTYVG